MALVLVRLGLFCYVLTRFVPCCMCAFVGLIRFVLFCVVVLYCLLLFGLDCSDLFMIRCWLLVWLVSCCFAVVLGCVCWFCCGFVFVLCCCLLCLWWCVVA